VPRKTYKSQYGTPQTVQGYGDLTVDAWGRPKTSLDYSLVHGVFTSSIPLAVWFELFNGTERAITNATSVDGKLHLVSGASATDVSVLCTYRNPRYQPNRGHLYSSSVFMPSKDAVGIREWGIFTLEAGYFFRLRDGILYAVRRSTVASVTTDFEELITELPDDIDFEMGNIYDIQMQWRGVGNIMYYIGDPATGFSILVHTMKLLNTLTELSVMNPALPIAFSCENTDGTEVVIECGCVDISTEGGGTEQRIYGSIGTSTDTGSVAITGLNSPVLAMHNKSTFNSLINTQDIVMLFANAWSDQKSFVRLWNTRDSTAISDPVWVDYLDGHLEYAEADPAAGTPITFDTTKAALIFGNRLQQDTPFSTPAIFEDKTEIYLTPGDYLLVTIHRENGMNANVGATIEFAEEI